MAAVEFEALKAAVREQAPDTLLDQVAAAMTIGGELAVSGDDLIDYFVAQARRDGCSWTQIGDRMGVSKQAARQRFAEHAVARAVADGRSGPAVAAPRRRRRGRGRVPECSFCGKPRADDLRLIPGPGVFICAECVELASEILAE